MSLHVRLLILLAFFSFGSTMAQSPADWWFFGYNAGVHFTGSGPVVATGSSIQTQEGCASISDQNGNLLFYTDGGTVWNANHAVMTNGTGLMGNFSSTQSSIIVPFPGSTSKYYIFTVPVTSSVGLRYTVVDMALSGGLGSVDNSNKNILVSNNVGEKVTSVGHGNGTDYWVMCVGVSTTTVRAFHVSSSGVNTTPVVSASPANFGSGIGYLKASPSGNKVAAGIYTGSPTGLVLWEFNNQTGALSNAIQVTGIGSVYGVEFSPNDSLVYAGTSNAIYQYSMATWNATAVASSQYTVTSGTYYGWALQLGPDEKIYSVIYLSNWLQCINSPNVQGAGCGFVQNSVNLSTGQARIGLPTFVQSFFNPQVNFAGLCLGDSTFFTFDSTGVDSTFWDFGDPNSGASNYSTEFFPGHIFSDTGNYTVSLVAYIDSFPDTSTYDVYIYPRQTAILGNDTSLCVGDTVSFSVDQPFASFSWSTGSTDSAILVTNDSIIMVTVTGYCDTLSDTVNIDFYYPFVVDLGPDTSMCTYDSKTIQTGLPSNGLQFAWSTGSAQPYVVAIDTGEYSVTVTNGSCEYSDTINVEFFPEVTVDLGHDSNFCYEPLVTLTPTTGNVFSYEWSTGSTSPTLDITQSGTYTITAYGTGGFCEAVDSVRWDLWFEPLVNLGNDTSFCHNDVLTLTPTAQSAFPLEFRWNDNSSSPTMTTNMVGLYWVEASDMHCAIRDTIEVGQYPILDVELGEDIQSCEGKTTVLDPQITLPVTEMNWSTGESSNTISIKQHGTYSVTVSNGLCTANDVVNVFYNDYPVVDLGPDTTMCPDDEMSFDLSSISVYEYQWYDGASQPTHVVAADRDQKKIWVEVTNIVCTTVDSLTITQRELPAIGMEENASFCEGTTLTLSAVGDTANTHTWSTGEQDMEITVSQPGSYKVTAFDGWCEHSKTVNVEELVLPEFSLEHPDYLCTGEQYTMKVDVDHSKLYRWSDGSTTNSLTVDKPGFYWVEAHHPCSVLRDSALILDCECYIHLPTAFKPDGDGVNDFFGPSVECTFSQFDFKVFNRWGEVIFESSDPKAVWDGTFNGIEVTPGAYGWTLDYEGLLNGSLFNQTRSGSVVVLR